MACQPEETDQADGTAPAGGAEPDEVVLAGGGRTAQVVRRHWRGVDAVHRSAGPWTPTVHRLLEHLAARGVTWLPRPLGRDEQGREVLTFLLGTVPVYPFPAWVWAPDVLATTGRWLALAHRASLDFDASPATGATWQLPVREPVEVVRLNDVTPYNTVFDADHRPSGWIDVDTASPGPRAWDLAHTAYRFGPLTGAADTGAGAVDAERARARLVTLCRAYGAAWEEAAGLPAPTPADVLAELVPLLRSLAEDARVPQHAALYRADAAWVAARTDQLLAG